jgi:5'-3' exonuclease
MHNIEAKGFIFCFSGVSSNTFRNCVAFDKKYKGGRDYTPLYDKQEEDKIAVIKYIRDRYPSLLFKDLEADDVLSFLQDDDTFIYSKDKDLLQIPGTHYDIKQDQFIEIPETYAFTFLMKQMVTGDSVDNITGLKGWGPVKCDELLTNVPVHKMPEVILMEYMKKFGMFNGIDTFVETWNLVKLRGNRGEFFLQKYQSAFDLKRMLKNMK